MSAEKNNMPDNIRQLYIILLKNKWTARQYLEHNLVSQHGTIRVYRGKVAAWISGYVL